MTPSGLWIVVFQSALGYQLSYQTLDTLNLQIGRENHLDLTDHESQLAFSHWFKPHTLGLSTSVSGSVTESWAI